MTKVYCDGCGKELGSDDINTVRDQPEFVWKGFTGSDILIKAQVAVNKVWNSGDLCSGCLIVALQSVRY